MEKLNYNGTKSYSVGDANRRNSKIKQFMKLRGITTVKTQKKTLILYGEFAKTDRPTFHANENWKTFKDWLDKRMNYTKPSKRKKFTSEPEELELERLTMNTD